MTSKAPPRWIVRPKAAPRWAARLQELRRLFAERHKSEVADSYYQIAYEKAQGKAGSWASCAVGEALDLGAFDKAPKGRLCELGNAFDLQIQLQEFDKAERTLQAIESEVADLVANVADKDDPQGRATPQAAPKGAAPFSYRTRKTCIIIDDNRGPRHA